MKANIINFASFLFLTIFLHNQAIAQLLPAAPKNQSNDPEATAILKKLKDKYTSFASLYSEYVLTIDNRETKETQNGKITQKGNKFHVDNNGNQIFCDGVTIWMYVKNNNVVQINNFEEDEDPMSPGRILKIYESENEYLYAITSQDQVKAEVEFKPLKKDADFFKIRIEVDKTRNEVRYIKVFAKDGTTYTLDIKTIRSAAPTDAQFVFKKESFPGVKVEDLR